MELKTKDAAARARDYLAEADDDLTRGKVRDAAAFLLKARELIGELRGARVRIPPDLHRRARAVQLRFSTALEVAITGRP